MIRIGMVFVGLLLTIYGGGAFLYSFIGTVDTTVEWYKGVAQCVFGGLSLAAVGVYGKGVIDKVKGFVPNKNKTPEAKVIEKDNTMDVVKDAETKVVDKSTWNFLIENYDHLDTLAKNLEKPEDKELCRNLQKRLLEIHHTKSCEEK